MLHNKGLNLEVDNLDLAILAILMRNAMTPFTEIAKELLISGGTVHVRMKKMTDLGIIKGAHLQINPQKIGYDVCAFLGIYLEKGSHYNQAADQLKQIKEIVELHYCTGSYSMFAKVICRDTAHLREVLNERIQAVEGIQRTETFISLEERVKRPINIQYE